MPPPTLADLPVKERHPPQGEMEEVLAEIWRSVLALEAIGREDDFFEIGGHSLLAMRVVASLQSSLSLDVPIRSLFQFPTLKEMATHIGELRRQRLRSSIANGGTEIAALLDRLAAMEEGEAQDLLSELSMEARQ